MSTTFPVDLLRTEPTPFYYYDTRLLADTLAAIKAATAGDADFHVHYAVKANAHPELLHYIAEAGLGADCVSGGEIRASLSAGFPADSIVFAGVGKSDWEIALGLDADIFCFNVESLPELEVINELAAAADARPAWRSASTRMSTRTPTPTSRRGLTKTSSALPWRT